MSKTYIGGTPPVLSHTLLAAKSTALNIHICTQYQLTSAPTLNLLSTAPIALSINTYGTNNATSLSGLLSVILDAIFLANVSASSFDWGFSFQFPEMNGLRAFRAVELTAAWLPVVVNAVAEPNKREARASFMV